ncbi:MAG: ammonium transporter [Endomicrobiaceae bacterium]|jgi:Amt family ammonium transporter|nr:ammonium transporter [Endomicrobiaceae bacterium]MDD3730059.1 ammonium transporter [Endomicrobiaceae bacterium]MDD4165705.1 ammonium transporter [Endomicrobiaceae bacterium]
MKKFLLLFILGFLIVSSGVLIADDAVVADTTSVAVAAPVVETPAETSAPAPKIDTGDTAFMLICSALVMVMTPGLALFYGGMVRRKNVLGTMMHSFVALGLITIIWIVYGYSLAFGKDVGHIIGNLDWAFLKGVGLDPNPDYSGTIPHQLFMVFQMMFAILTPALITGAFAERFKFKSYLIFLAVWLTVVYCPVAHWVWGVDGWIRNLGGLDFAGGLVVHIASGTSALITILVIGKRKGYQKEIMPPHSLPLTLIGTALLWFGWFGFNAGSALSAGALASSAFVVTQVGAGAAVLGWMFIEWIQKGKPTMLGALSGGVAGLVAITPASGFVSPMSAIIIGLAGGVVCYMAVNMKEKIGYDDSLDVVGVHGVGGFVGAMLTGVFASVLVNPAGADGSLHLLKTQFLSSVSVIIYASLSTFIILKIIDKLFGLRVEDVEEQQGLDLTQHGESGYRF